jgi:hypothetical protein
MSRVVLPPKTEPIVDNEKFPTLDWLAYFEGQAAGDFGTTWTPVFTGLTEVGVATKTGTFYRLSNKLAYFRIVITPTTSTTAVAGTTYCDNFPLQITAASFSTTCSGSTAAVAGITSADKRIYTAAWTALVNPITITGFLEVR